MFPRMNSFRNLTSLLWVSVTTSVVAKELHCPAQRFHYLSRRMAHTIREVNSENTEEYRVYFQGNNGLISPFHDIPLFADKDKKIFNMVVEIPKWTNAKMEIATKERLNPIKQDVKKGKVRFVNNVFPYRGYIWNYGAIPQTWEDPNFIDENTKYGGDNDPIDVCEIGNKVGYRGEVKQVKVLGVMALIDEEETDWKVMTIDVSDPLADKMNDVDDIRKYMPGLLEATYEWFKVYKIPTGKPPNQFAFNGEAKNRDFAIDVIMHTHECWRKLILKEIENKQGLACDNVSMEKSPYKISEEELNKIAAGLGKRDEPSPIPSSVDKLYYIKDDKLVEG